MPADCFNQATGGQRTKWELNFYYAKAETIKHAVSHAETFLPANKQIHSPLTGVIYLTMEITEEC